MIIIKNIYFQKNSHTCKHFIFFLTKLYLFASKIKTSAAFRKEILSHMNVKIGGVGRVMLECA